MAGRRKRPHVPEDSRKRAARACDACRKVKERCEGGIPCMRCSRLHRDCEYVETTPTTRGETHQDESDDSFYDRERIEALENIVQHYSGTEDFAKINLIRVVDSLHRRDEKVRGINIASRDKNDEMHTNPHTPNGGASSDGFSVDPASSKSVMYTNGLSHHDFSRYVQQRLNKDLSAISEESENDGSFQKALNPSRASRLHSQQAIIDHAAAAFPPFPVAIFLIDIFFEYAQTNYFYVDEQSLRQKIENFYSGSEAVGPEDASWLCTVLSIFAVGTQFAHLSSHDGQDEVSISIALDHDSKPLPDDDAAVSFYHAASRLIPYAISLASIDSVQAFLLLAVYTLPIDAAGLSFTYLGIAVKMAIQNGMHRTCLERMDRRTIEIRNRIWWTTYTLEKRVCVLHGRPTSLPGTEVDAAQPSDLHSLRPEGRIDTLPNVLAMIQLTMILEKARDTITRMKTQPQEPNDDALAPISQLAPELHEFWQSLPSETYCKDLTPGKSLFRFNIHLAMTFHLVQVFMGRSFIFASPVRSLLQQATQRGKIWASPVTSCEDSAIKIIELCQILKDEAGLARASYTEYTSCRAALLALFAHRIVERTDRLKGICDQALTLLKHMSLGFYSADAEKAEIKAMEIAIRRIDESNLEVSTDNNSASTRTVTAYEQFRKWAMLWKEEGTGRSNSTSPRSNVTNSEPQTLFGPSNPVLLSPLQNFGWDVYMPFSPFGPNDGSMFDPTNVQW